MDFDKCFDSDKGSAIWGFSWRAYMIKRTERVMTMIRDICGELDTETVLHYLILEIGCAAGDSTAQILRVMGAEGRLIGCDVSDNAVRICKKRFDKEKRATFETMGLPNITTGQSSDLTICIDVVHYFTSSQYKECFQNIYSNTRIGGTVIVQVPLEYVDEGHIIDAFNSVFVLEKKEYVYGQLWYETIEKWLQPLVQATYIEKSNNPVKRICGWFGYHILKSKSLVSLSFTINRVIFPGIKSHIILVGKV